ncbi:MAG TPA: DMT family transporter [Gaiellaceae bacterium]|nr:DMT family transporter [Gaiellaceae bacterium]
MSSGVRGSASLVGAVVVWGATFVGSKVALRHLAPSELAFLRQAFGLPPLLWLAWRTRQLLLPVRYLVPLSATGMVGFFLFANLGLERTSASLGGLVQGLVPAAIAVLAVAFLGERPTARVVGGIVLALGGAGVLAWGTLHVGSSLGLAFLFLSVLSWATYAVIGRHLGTRITAVEATVLPVCLSVVAFAFGPLFERWDTAPARTFALAAVLGFFGSGVSYAMWSYGIARIPAARAGVYSNLVPVVAVVLAWAALGESLSARQLAGGAVVLAGAVLASFESGYEEIGSA